MFRKNTFTKLFFLTFFLLIPTLSRACPSAGDLAGVGAEPVLADCLELARFNIETGRGMVQGSIYGAPETDLALVGAAEEALTRSGAALRGLSGLGSGPVDLYISPTSYTLGDESDETMAAAQLSSESTPGGSRTCVMAAFPTLALGEYRYTIAHEFFHCVQLSEFRSAEARSGSAWWVEGSAEWFASLTYPGSALSDGWVAGFDEISATVPVTQMEYASVVFFWWLSQNFGNGRVVGLLNAMNGGGSQEDALAGVVSEQDFLKFVTDYLEQNISQPGGRAAASTPVHEEILDIGEDREITLETQRFVAYRAMLKFTCGGWESLERDRKGVYKALRLPDGDWQKLPAEFQSDSEAKIDFLVAGAATDEEGFNLFLEVKKSPCIPCQAPQYSDGPEACLIGEWYLTSGGMGAKIGEMLGDVPELSEIDYPDLDGFLSLRSDGTFTLKADDRGSMQTTAPSGGIFSADISISMEKQGTWSVNGDKLVQCYAPIKSINIDETITDPDGETTRITGDRFLGPKLSYTEKRQFICEEGRLEINQRALFAPSLQWVYEK
ncbi:hypothetical protein MNBD_ALPHA07-853 [hydrothermal vent metagenome]|uniref:Uncharacterized protein n=1 Tax=hydrothermal vent metagenome TaxID=652676 RepID=A0A3B0SFQ7_9ZZZZ